MSVVRAPHQWFLSSFVKDGDAFIATFDYRVESAFNVFRISREINVKMDIRFEVALIADMHTLVVKQIVVTNSFEYNPNTDIFRRPSISATFENLSELFGYDGRTILFGKGVIPTFDPDALRRVNTDAIRCTDEIDDESVMFMLTDLTAEVELAHASACRDRLMLDVLRAETFPCHPNRPIEPFAAYHLPRPQAVCPCVRHPTRPYRVSSAKHGPFHCNPY